MALNMVMEYLFSFINLGGRKQQQGQWAKGGNYHFCHFFVGKTRFIGRKHLFVGKTFFRRKSEHKKTARAVRSEGGRGMSRIPALSLVMNSPLGI